MEQELSFPSAVTCLIVFEDKLAIAQKNGRIEIYKIISSPTQEFQLLVQFQQPLPRNGKDLKLLLGHFKIGKMIKIRF